MGMSERYGPCKTCKGEGKVRHRDCILLRDEWMDCGGCDGTGFSGDIEDRKNYEDLKKPIYGE